MDHGAPPSAPPRPALRVVMVALAIVGVATAAVVGPRSLASTPTTTVAGVATSWATEASGSSAPSAALDEDDGVVPDGATVSVFDETSPAVDRLDPELRAALRGAAADAEAERVELRVNSGWRSPAHQEELLREAVAEHGSEEEAARWVATPETSAHVAGDAVDVGPPYAAAWLAEHGAVHGLCPIYANEPWHFELRPGAATDGCPPLYADPTEDPRMQR